MQKHLFEQNKQQEFEKYYLEFEIFLFFIISLLFLQFIIAELLLFKPSKKGTKYESNILTDLYGHVSIQQALRNQKYCQKIKTICALFDEIDKEQIGIHETRRTDLFVQQIIIRIFTSILDFLKKIKGIRELFYKILKNFQTFVYFCLKQEVIKYKFQMFFFAIGTKSIIVLRFEFQNKPINTILQDAQFICLDYNLKVGHLYRSLKKLISL